MSIGVVDAERTPMRSLMAMHDLLQPTYLLYHAPQKRVV